MNITTIGIDLANTSFSLAGTDKYGKVVLRKTMNRGKLLSQITAAMQFPGHQPRQAGNDF